MVFQTFALFPGLTLALGSRDAPNAGRLCLWRRWRDEAGASIHEYELVLTAISRFRRADRCDRSYCHAGLLVEPDRRQVVVQVMSFSCVIFCTFGVI
jgi:hypothetical protein